MQQSEKPKLARLKTSAMLTACAISLMGCGATLPQSPTESATLPARPSISTPLPPVSYSISAAEDIARWRKMLKDTQLLSNY